MPIDRNELQAIRERLIKRGPLHAGMLGRAHGLRAPLAILGNRTRVYPDRIEHKGNTYPIPPGTKARLDAQGGSVTEQGWTMKTTHDNRELFVVVESPDYYLEIRAYKGSSVATDAGTMVQNAAYRQANAQARQVISAINNAALGMHRVPLIENAEKRELLEHHLDEARRDLATLTAQEDLGWGRNGLMARRLRWGIRREIQDYESLLS